MDTKSKVISRKDIEMVVAPCPKCGSWMTDPIDKEKRLWACGHMDCRTPFNIKNHHALVIMKSGEVIRVDKQHQYKLQ